jgi:hypothetical protein
MGVRVRTPPPQILFLPRKKVAGRRMHHGSHPAALVI